MSIDSKAVPSLEFVDNYRDARLDMALDLLKQQEIKPPSMMVPLVASIALASSTMLLVLIVIMGPGWDETGRLTGHNLNAAGRAPAQATEAPVAAAVIEAPTANAPNASFQLSNSPDGSAPATIVGGPSLRAQTVQSGSEN